MLNQGEIQALFNCYPALDELSPELQQSLLHDGQPLKAQARQIMFDIGSPCQSFIALTYGSLRVTKPTSSGREILLYRVQPGEYCIMTATCLLGESAYPARGVAEADLIGYSLPRTLFMTLIEQVPAFRASVFSLLAQRMAHLMDLIEDIAFSKMDQRLAALLLTKGPIIKITHQELADELGSAREVISRILKTFEAHGFLQLGRGYILILEPAALQEFGRLLRDLSH